MNLKRVRVGWLLALCVLALQVTSACGSSASHKATATRPPAAAVSSTAGVTGQPVASTTRQPTSASESTATEPTGAAPTEAAAAQATPTAPTEDPATATTVADTTHVLTPDELQQFKPNELGEVPILEYHQLGPDPEQFIRTPDQFRGDLQWLYDNNFHVVSLHDFLTSSIDIPAGKKPVVLTFDDSSASQFRVSENADGTLAIDPNCAVGIMELFFGAHPDFGHGATFAVLPQTLFDWGATDESDQTQFGETKLQWLVDNGYEIGNHTYSHVDLSTLSDDEIMQELSKANDAILSIVPTAQIEAITLPYGMYPDGGDDTLLRGFDLDGKSYHWVCALEVGADPALNPYSTDYDPYATARIQAFDDELNKWKETFAENPGILYVSDGNPKTVTVPNDLHPWLVGTLDESKLGDKQLIRY
jgi:peptidoglycan/xylan/chitin deacetylase (PgdA/CDA1 family)